MIVAVCNRWLRIISPVYNLKKNSGLFGLSQNVYNALHTPVAIFSGGPADIAYENGARDYQNINSVPILFANLPVGHGATYGEDNGGEFARVGVAWLDWWLKT